MGHPRGGNLLAAEMAGLATAGVDVIVSALMPGEERRLGLTGAARAAAAAGIQHVACPIPDRGVPEDVVALGVRLAAHVRAGRFVVAQCFAGIGRSTLLAGVTLVMLGVRPERALGMVEAARGLPVPGNEAQRLWLHDFAAAHGGFTGGNPVGRGISAPPHRAPGCLALPACTYRSSSSTASTPST
ncbi:tyrosine protein phosphatase [Actinoplanes sp. NPDC049681]|uniref:tyrosine protein phosphatase n=1 Tax=Actinoplanes sp. NPDC049681 TaxID=3363905 RepID=UPI00378ED97C